MSRALVQNLDLYLINEGQSWYLSDAGGFDSWLDPHATRIVQAVQAVIPPGQKLTYVICEPLPIPADALVYPLFIATASMLCNHANHLRYPK